MFDLFSHYLSYGATDQQTARLLTGVYDGLLVPGTIAAFQADGTRGFVLTLSASRKTRYVIDPRFPLFQNRLSSPKKSHEALAAIFGSPELISRDTLPSPETFTQAGIDRVARNWLAFNSGYTEVSSKHFSKYAERLGEEVVPEARSGPEYVLPPYVIAGSGSDDWWAVSTRLWESSVRQSGDYGLASQLVRVVAATNAEALGVLLRDCEQDHLAIWVNALDELDTGASARKELLDYGRAIQGAFLAGKKLFALYGGFFSVLLSIFGLRGSSHGIGYGEARDWVELPQSGPPPARYYLPKAHRYVGQDLAALLYRDRRSHQLAICDCEECEGQNPAELDYQGLMRHSVRCRQREIIDWTARLASEATIRLREDARVFENVIADMDIPRPLRRQADQCYTHLPGWADVIEQLDGGGLGRH